MLCLAAGWAQQRWALAEAWREALQSRQPPLFWPQRGQQLPEITQLRLCLWDLALGIC